MNNLQLYKRGFWLMLILNILVLVNFLIVIPLFIHSKEAPGDRASMQLKLNQEQMVSFKKLADGHQNEMRTLNKEQKTLIPSYFASLSQPSSASNRDSVATKIQHIERQKLEVTYKHFEDIKSILTPDQEKDFPEFVERTLFRILAKNSGPRGNR